MRRLFSSILVICMFQASGMYDCFSDDKIKDSRSSSREKEFIRLPQMFEKGHLTKDGRCISFWNVSVNEVSDEEWAYWTGNRAKLFDSEKVDTVVVGFGFLSVEIMSFFASCKNLEDLRLGDMIDGSICPQDAFLEIEKLKNLQNLELAVFGLNDDFLGVLAELKTLEHIAISFPSLIIAPKIYKDKAPKEGVLLSDKASETLLKRLISSLFG